MSEIEIMTELKVTAKKPASFYVRAAATFLRGTRTKEPVDELRVSGLGAALDVAVQVATRMERDGIGHELIQFLWFPLAGAREEAGCLRFDLLRTLVA
eukprot:Skav228372  [mRNA]  locus=scaffold1981:253314:256501:+ [translate_table: standard]